MSDGKLKKFLGWVIKPFRRLRHHHPPLLPQLGYWAILVVVLMVIAYSLFSWHLGVDPNAKLPKKIDVTKMALTVAAGFGALVALVVAYRKQRDAEEGRFVERFTVAKEQLGHTDVAVRMAGVYAMAGVADRTRDKEQRQQCIDVLCGYLRLPYDPTIVEDHQTLTIIRTPEREGVSPSKEIHFQYRQNDSEVRKTIVRIIANHSRREDSQSWSECSFDFTSEFFEDANFTGSRFNGNYVVFNGATFSGGITSFAGTTFGGVITSFDGATFSGDITSFREATLSGSHISFRRATFIGRTTTFAKVTFSGKNTSFTQATFGEGSIDFWFPLRWNPATRFDWDDPASGILKPDNVKPDVWPPTPEPDQKPEDS